MSGLRYLDECYKSGSLRQYFAAILLVVHHTTLSPPTGLTKEKKLELFQYVDMLLDDGITVYGEGVWFQVVKALTLIESDKPDKHELAIASVESAIANAQHLIENPPIPLRTISNMYACNYQVDVFLFLDFI